ncbi:MAG: ribosome recycling factor [Thermoleophilia bacterium]
MEGAAKAFGQELASVRTGRASTQLLDRVHVDAYGADTPLNQVAQINAPEPRLLTIQPYDNSLAGTIEKAIMESDLGLTPTNDGKIIRIAIPQLTEERRKEMVRLVGKMAEEQRVAVRNVRRDVLNEAKRAEKDNEMTKDDLSRFQDEVQKLTDAEVAVIDEMLERKEAEIMEV